MARALEFPALIRPNLPTHSPNPAFILMSTRNKPNRISSSLKVLLAQEKATKIFTQKRPNGTAKKPLEIKSDAVGMKQSFKDGKKMVLLGGVTVGVALLAMMMGFDGDRNHQALAGLGPEGPAAEEFWENMRRYALYALTVSTGAVYTVFQPIVELLKNPFSALLILALVGATFYLVSQVLSAMVGVSDFTYQYGYYFGCF